MLNNFMVESNKDERSVYFQKTEKQSSSMPNLRALLFIKRQGKRKMFCPAEHQWKIIFVELRKSLRFAD